MASNKSPFDWPSSLPRIGMPLVTFSLYLSAIPVLRFLSAPSGFGANFLTPFLSSALRSVSSSSATLERNPEKAIALLSVFYMFMLYVCSAIMSATGQLLGNKGAGYKNREPRLNKRNLSGLPHRMVATHEALYDIFPAYALTAALAASTLSPISSPSALSSTLNPLVLHVFFKLAVFSPAYLLDIDIVRTYSHMCSVAALLVGMWGVVVG
ncbi:hypothetical protein C8R47DRAFT_1171919 [Mycena vitilis]|nr:hypothetical protein C8R47DRAFT_1171919 [Mycena vitilis]